ncbi:CLUMA_CG001031, isoform A [Clunio marinus]|uniref:CLUMA_CG001031, isoform A n=1 Tax=Clunio marinus TaxID=568069 RepID=A0A1J1HH68_9DIPT|nr:CLUMA_CG001031, isoform A [Clunio marinus]
MNVCYVKRPFDCTISMDVVEVEKEKSSTVRRKIRENQKNPCLENKTRCVEMMNKKKIANLPKKIVR